MATKFDTRQKKPPRNRRYHNILMLFWWCNRRKHCEQNGTDGKLMPDLSIKVRFYGPLLTKNKKAKTRKNQGFMRVFCMAGALGLEPRTNGFGAAKKVRNPLKILAFCKNFQSIKTLNATLWCFFDAMNQICFIISPRLFWCFAKLKVDAVIHNINLLMIHN